jgi:NADP-dependent aldehyde dehydrogenase
MASLCRALGKHLRPADGSLVAGVFSADEDDPDASACLALLSGKVGRLCANDWPTGVSYTWAQQHGGPVAVDLDTIGNVGGRCRPESIRAAGNLSIAEGRVAAASAPGSKPVEPSPSGRRRASTA